MPIAASTSLGTIPAFGEPVLGAAIARPGYGGILLGAHTAPLFDPQPIARRAGCRPRVAAGRRRSNRRRRRRLRWPRHWTISSPTRPGIYGILIASPDRVLARTLQRLRRARSRDAELVDDQGHHLHADRPADPRGLARLGLRSGAGAAVARSARHPSSDHVGPPAAHALGARLSRCGTKTGDATIGFENSAVYQDAPDAFEAAQRSIVATIPGSVFRYINAGLNVLGADHPRPHRGRGTALSPDRLPACWPTGSAWAAISIPRTCAGNLIASGAGFATLRDYAKLGVLYLQDGVWDGERLLPEGWVDYALTPTHTGTSYAACFRTNVDRSFPDLPPDTAWASGASDQRIFILRRHRLVARSPMKPIIRWIWRRSTASSPPPSPRWHKKETPCPPSATSRAKNSSTASCRSAPACALTRSVEIAKAMETAGFDWLFLDLEHGTMSLDACAQIAAAALDAGIAPIVRVPNGEYSIATRRWTMARSASSCRMSIRAAEAREVVEKLKYPPVGHRSMGGIGPHYSLRSASTGEAAKALNAANLTVVMLETPTAIANADEIAAVPGVDVLLIGTNDLCAEMGIPGDFGNDRVADAYRTMIAAAASMENSRAWRASTTSRSCSATSRWARASSCRAPTRRS